MRLAKNRLATSPLRPPERPTLHPPLPAGLPYTYPPFGHRETAPQTGSTNLPILPLPWVLCAGPPALVLAYLPY